MTYNIFGSHSPNSNETSSKNAPWQASPPHARRRNAGDGIRLRPRNRPRHALSSPHFHSLSSGTRMSRVSDRLRDE